MTDCEIEHDGNAADANLIDFFSCLPHHGKKILSS